MYCMRYLDDISSLITIACCVPELRTIELCPFSIENVLGGATFPPPSTISMGNRPNSLAHNSRTQQAIVIILEISSKFIIQYILGENPGNPTLLINQWTGSDISGKWSIELLSSFLATFCSEGGFFVSHLLYAEEENSASLQRLFIEHIGWRIPWNIFHFRGIGTDLTLVRQIYNCDRARLWSVKSFLMYDF